MPVLFMNVAICSWVLHIEVNIDEMKWCLDEFALNIPGVCLHFLHNVDSKIKQMLTVVISGLCNYG